MPNECTALIIGVSEYDRHDPLPKCVNDAKAMRDAVVNDLFVPKDSVTCLSGRVTKSQFADSFEDFLSSQSSIGILYFSGHGSQNNYSCNLQFTDKAEPATLILRQAQERFTSLLIILDCCYAGALDPNFDLGSVLESDVGDGCFLILASSKDEEANVGDDGPYSLFTDRLLHSLRAGYSKARGVVDFDTVSLSLRASMKTHNKQASENDQQHVAIRNLTYSPPQFKNPDFKLYQQKPLLPVRLEHCTIRGIEPLHTASYKRYAARIMVPDSSSITAVLRPSQEALTFTRQCESYGSGKLERRWRDRPTTHVFLCFYDNELDFDNSNAQIMATWVEENANRSVFYKESGFVINGIFYEESDIYQTLRKLIGNNTMTPQQCNNALVSLSDTVIARGKQVFNWFESYQNNELHETALIDAITAFKPKYAAVSHAVQELGFPHRDYRKAVDLLIDMDGAITDSFLFYTHDEYLKRDEENRTICMSFTLRRFNQAVEEYLREIKRLGIKRE